MKSSERRYRTMGIVGDERCHYWVKSEYVPSEKVFPRSARTSRRLGTPDTAPSWGSRSSCVFFLLKLIAHMHSCLWNLPYFYFLLSFPSYWSPRMKVYPLNPVRHSALSGDMFVGRQSGGYTLLVEVWMLLLVPGSCHLVQNSSFPLKALCSQMLQ